MKTLTKTLLQPFTLLGVFIYCFLGIFIDNNPAEMLLYLLPEVLVFILFGVLFEIFLSESIGAAIGRTILYTVVASLILVMVFIPISLVLYLNDSVQPALNLFHSERAFAIVNYMDHTYHWYDLYIYPIFTFKYPILIALILLVLPFAFKKFNEGSVIERNKKIPFEIRYVAYLSLGFLVAILPAYLLHFIWPAAFPFVVIIGMRIIASWLVEIGSSKKD